MPIAGPEKYRSMLEAAAGGGYALAAVSVTSTTTLNAAMAGFAQAGADGIIQLSIGASEFASGRSVGNAAAGAEGLALFAHRTAREYPVNIALQTDHCPPEKLDYFVRPLLDASRRRADRGKPPLFAGHMFDGGRLPLHRNLGAARRLLEEMKPLGVVLEIEIGVIGGVEDGEEEADGLYSSPQDMVETVRRLGPGGRGGYLLAAAFGNVHGVYRPEGARLDPQILAEGQAAVEKEFGVEARHRLVFHGGSGTDPEAVRRSIDYGVVKMNINTDTRYVYSRAAADHMFAHRADLLDINSENPSGYDPRVWMAKAEQAMTERVAAACAELRSAGASIG